MKITFPLVLIALTCGCSSPDPSDKTDPTTNNATSGSNNATPDDDMARADVGTPDVGPPRDMGGDRPDFGAPPAAITSAGATFEGHLGPMESVRLDLTVFQADRVTMWLRKANGTDWDPSINVLRAGQTDVLVYGNPQGNADASIPFRSGELGDGYEFWFTGTYPLVLENLGGTAGDFTFTLECRGGPCAIVAGDADLDGVDDAADPCAYNPGDCTTDPYAGLADLQLEEAIRADHTGHVVMNYVEARVHMFAWIDKDQGQVECVYTGDRVTTDEIPEPAQMNTEHGWPQSRSGGDPASESDLHHLYPTKPDANTERAALYFGEVVNADWQRGGSSKGRNAAGDTVFEPRDQHKGDAARALFYYAVTYNVNMRREEETVLRQWNTADPPDDAERRRHQSIANVQNSRNPFVDYPALADRINDF